MDVRLVGRMACRCCFFFPIAVSPIRAQWIKLTTPHFEMYTTNTRVKGLEALETLEEARRFFNQNSPSETVTEMRIRIIVFRSEKEFRPYSANPGAIAFYQRGHGRDYIVMRDLGPGSYSVAIHEYTHLYLEHHNLHLPLWLNEGLADVYSTLQPRGGQLIVGLPPPGRIEALRTAPLLDLHQLFGVNEQSSYYRNPAQMSQFYSASWGLTHMLLLGRNYSAGFRRFMAAVEERNGAEKSFQDVYGRTLDEVASDLRDYLSQPDLGISYFDARLDQREIPEVTDSSDEDVELVLADLLSTHRGSAAEAHARLTGLAEESPHNPDVQRSLGYLAWQQGNTKEAKEHFEEAVREGSTDALMILQYAGLLHTSHGSPAQIIGLLERAVELKPDLMDARFSLGMEAANQGQCQVALPALSAIKTITSDRAYPLYSVLAYCTWKQGDAPDARHWVELAKRYAETQQERANTEQLIQQLNQLRR